VVDGAAAHKSNAVFYKDPHAACSQFGKPERRAYILARISNSPHTPQKCIEFWPIFTNLHTDVHIFTVYKIKYTKISYLGL